MSPEVTHVVAEVESDMQSQVGSDASSDSVFIYGNELMCVCVCVFFSGPGAEGPVWSVPGGRPRAEGLAEPLLLQTAAGRRRRLPASTRITTRSIGAPPPHAA